MTREGVCYWMGSFCIGVGLGHLLWGDVGDGSKGITFGIIIWLSTHVVYKLWP